MKELILHIIVVLGCISLTSCRKNECKLLGRYMFELPATLSPVLDTFRVGDTITVRSYFPDEIYDRTTSRHYKLENFSFLPSTKVLKIDEDTIINAFPSHIEPLLDPKTDYSLYYGSVDEYYLMGEYRYADNHYHLEYKLVLREAGLYYHRFGSSVAFTDQTFEGKCPHTKRYRSLDGAVKINNGDAYENNVEFLKDAPDNTFALNSYYRHEQFNRLGGYCFYVVE